jgi:hypothetical protein
MKIAISMKIKYLLVNRNCHACSNQACAQPEFNAKVTQLNQYARVVLEVEPIGKGFSNPAASPYLPDGCMHFNPLGQYMLYIAVIAALYCTRYNNICAGCSHFGSLIKEQFKI